jgi:hypothetical protein
MSTFTLDTLPVEILHRIYDSLDIETIVLSVRYVCQQLYLTTNSYNRYDFNFQCLSKHAVRSICRFVSIENVISLTLSNEDRTKGQISYVRSLLPLEHFIRLRSLTLLHINRHDIYPFLTYIRTSNLRYLHIESNHDCTISNDLPSIVTHPTIEHLQMDIHSNDRHDINWPLNTNLTHVRLFHCITYEQFSCILQQSTHLQALHLKDIPQNRTTIDTMSTDKVYSSLVSLTIDDTELDLEQFNRCLSLTPWLTYVKLIGHGRRYDTSYDGCQWENILKQKLLQLKTFEFFFVIPLSSNYHTYNLEFSIKPFQSTFWLEHIQCSIICDYLVRSRKFLLYTLPICVDHFTYHTTARRVRSVNMPVDINVNNMRHVTRLELKFTREINHLLGNKVND